MVALDPLKRGEISSLYAIEVNLMSPSKSMPASDYRQQGVTKRKKNREEECGRNLEEFCKYNPDSTNTRNLHHPCL